MAALPVGSMFIAVVFSSDESMCMYRGTTMSWYARCSVSGEAMAVGSRVSKSARLCCKCMSPTRINSGFVSKMAAAAMARDAGLL